MNYNIAEPNDPYVLKSQFECIQRNANRRKNVRYDADGLMSRTRQIARTSSRTVRF